MPTSRMWPYIFTSKTWYQFLKRIALSGSLHWLEDDRENETMVPKQRSCPIHPSTTITSLSLCFQKNMWPCLDCLAKSILESCTQTWSSWKCSTVRGPCACLICSTYVQGLEKLGREKQCRCILTSARIKSRSTVSFGRAITHRDASVNSRMIMHIPSS